jgi:hypothetical protein
MSFVNAAATLAASGATSLRRPVTANLGNFPPGGGGEVPRFGMGHG